MRSMSLLLMAAAATACTTAPEEPRTAKAEAHLQKLLAGKSAGPAISCLSHHRADNMVVVDDNTVVFRDGATVYRNDFQGGQCSRLGSGFYAMYTRTSGTGLCRGDIAQVIDTTSGMSVGSCVLGDFVPYTKPRG